MGVAIWVCRLILLSGQDSTSKLEAYAYELPLYLGFWAQYKLPHPQRSLTNGYQTNNLLFDMFLIPKDPQIHCRCSFIKWLPSNSQTT
jgi:hypothetical protein